MSAENPELAPPMQADRRPAIWPWLVMPLIALSAFYCLARLDPMQLKFSDLLGRHRALAGSEADPGTSPAERP